MLPSIVSIPTTQLWIGQQDTIISNLYLYLQSVFCLQKGCGTCSICMQIINRQYYAIQWITKDKTHYSLESLEPLQRQLAYALADDEKHFFIFLEAETLSVICNNALLKSLEEPPRGYHFILATHYPHLLLPTLRSRSVIFEFNSPSDTMQVHHKPLFDHFTMQELPAHLFLEYLEKSKIDEWESAQLVEMIIRYWQHKLDSIIDVSSEESKKTMHILQILMTALDQLPSPGSAKIFWKNLYLQMD